MEQDGFDPLARFFLTFGDEVRQAGSREEPIDHRGFGELRHGEVRRIPIPRTPVNSRLAPSA
jgi:hypothetical protein